ncbi:MAG: NifU family protein [Rhizomicrobium sp.]
MTDQSVIETCDAVPANAAGIAAAMLETPASTPTQTAPTLAEQVTKALEELRPHLQRDGGDIELVEIDGDIVVVDMKGSCVGCALSSVTLAGVRKKLIDAVGRPSLRVVPKAAIVSIRRMRAEA